jgi:hypothetical protein
MLGLWQIVGVHNGAPLFADMLPHVKHVGKCRSES